MGRMKFGPTSADNPPANNLCTDTYSGMDNHHTIHYSRSLQMAENQQHAAAKMDDETPLYDPAHLRRCIRLGFVAWTIPNVIFLATGVAYAIRSTSYDFILFACLIYIVFVSILTIYAFAEMDRQIKRAELDTERPNAHARLHVLYGMLWGGGGTIFMAAVAMAVASCYW